jgi:hypothetical protein
MPWQKVASDLFELDGKHYILVIDYYSRYIELSQLTSQTSETVINSLKSIFARHGIPMVCISDNGPCYSSTLFKSFATTYGFSHVTSSPRYPQANGEAERAVQTAKALLRKASDPYLALLSYRITPVLNGLSPAQLLMSRQLRSTVPLATDKLKPQTVNKEWCARTDKRNKDQQKRNFDKKHRARIYPLYKINDNVWVTDLKCAAKIAQLLPNRSYIVHTSSGAVVRRNGRNLRTERPTPSHTSFGNDSIAAPLARCTIRDHTTVPLQQQRQS